MPFKILAHVQPRFREAAQLLEHDRQEKTSHAAIPVRERMDGFKLVMDEETIDQGIVPGILGVEVPLQLVKTFRQPFGRGWDETVVYANGHVRATELPGRPIPATDTRHQRFVKFT